MTTRAWVLLVILLVAAVTFVLPRRRLWAPATVVMLTLALVWVVGAV